MSEANGRADDLRGFAEELVASGRTPGATVAVTSADADLWAVAAGQADPAAGVPMTVETLGLIGSISKSATALLVLQAREQGLLELDDPVSRHLPWFAVRNPHGEISLRHLLMHTAGLPGDVSPGPPSAANVALLAGIEPAWPPGLRHHYSNPGYAALGLVVEAVYGRPVGVLLQERVLDPLGMSASLPAIGEAARDRLSAGHWTRDQERGWAPSNPLVAAPWVPYEAADGCICSTLADMCRYARMLLARGRPLVSPASFGLMVSDTVDDPDGGVYGYALRIERVDGVELVGHSGGMVGHHAQLLCDREHGLAAVALINGASGHRELALHALALARAEWGGAAAPVPPPLPEPAPPSPPPGDDHPLAGLYRSHNPWMAVVRVTSSGGKLTLRAADMEPVDLVEVGDGCFGLEGPSGRLPESVRFDLERGGRPQRLWWNGCEAYLRAPESV